MKQTVIVLTVNTFQNNSATVAN